MSITANHVAVVVVGMAACWCDLRTRRIPNLVTFGGAALAVAYATYTGGAAGATASIGGWFVGVAVFLPFFLLGGMGAGDVKLLGAIGAWLGPIAALWAGLYGALAGGVMAIALAAASGYLEQARQNIWLLLMHWRVVGLRPLPDITLDRSKGPRLPYALPIAAGAITAIWLG